jgi:hypothetical protein
MSVSTNTAILIFAAQICLQAQPLSGEERAKIYFKRLFNPISFVGSAAGSGISQWRDRPEDWPQGGRGYAYRYANSYGQHALRESLMFGTASIVHEDYRYAKSQDKGTRNRILHAIAGSVMARGDDGRSRVSISRIGGFAGAALISRLWQPDSTRTFGAAGVAFGTSMGISVGFNFAREFWPKKWKP